MSTAKAAAGFETRFQSNMRFFLRCLAYFKSDVPQILWSLLLIFLATLAGLLQPFPLAILIDSVTPSTAARSTAWQYRLILSFVPRNMLGRILGLAAATLGARGSRAGC